MCTIADLWMELGLHLEVSSSTLDKIRSDFKTPSRCLIGLLNHWVHIAYNPTYKELAEALRQIDHSDLASEVEKMFDKSLSGPGQLT